MVRTYFDIGPFQRISLGEFEQSRDLKITLSNRRLFKGGGALKGVIPLTEPIPEVEFNRQIDSPA